MEQHTERLPIACVEGWTTWQDWTGVRLADLAALAGGRRGGGAVLVESLQEAGAFRRRRSPPTRSTTPPRCWRCGSTAPTCRSITAIPARVIVPALPGVHNTKWVNRMTFVEA